MTFDRVKRINLDELPDELLSMEVAKIALLKCIKQFDAADAMSVRVNSTNIWLLNNDIHEKIQFLEVFPSSNEFAWLQNFRGLSHLSLGSLAPKNPCDLEFVLNQIPNPERLESLSIGPGFLIDESTDFRRFPMLRSLDLPVLPTGVFQVLIQKDPRLERILKK
jgi:hypothetical protein